MWDNFNMHFPIKKRNVPVMLKTYAAKDGM